MMCGGSFSLDAVAGTVKFGATRVTGECPTCGKRVAFVTAHGLPNRPRVLGEHLPKGAMTDGQWRFLRTAIENDGTLWTQWGNATARTLKNKGLIEFVERHCARYIYKITDAGREAFAKESR